MNNKPIEQPAVASALDRIGARRILQRVGVGHEPGSGLPSDTPEVSQLLADDGFDEALGRLARKLDREPSDVRSEAAGYLREMAATHSARVERVWDDFGQWLNRAHDVEVDDQAGAIVATFIAAAAQEFADALGHGGHSFVQAQRGQRQCAILAQR